MKEYFRKIKLTQDLSGFDYFENFLVTTVVTIFAVRVFLKLSGYPQIGGSGFHIAHMLWGGLILTICILLLLLFLDRHIKSICAVFAGIGFGLFIDELGKFVTADNNYFFRPAVGIIYIIFVLMFLILQLLKNKMEISNEEYKSNAIDIFRNSLVHGISESEKKLIDLYLEKAGSTFTHLKMYKAINETEKIKREPLKIFDKIKEGAENLINYLVTKKTLQIFLILLVEVQALLSFLLVTFVILYFTGLLDRLIEHGIVLELDFPAWAAMISAFCAGFLALGGLFVFGKSRKKAFLLVKYSLFISIFIVQFFIFWINQVGALFGIVFNILALQAVNLILNKEK